MTDLTAGLRPAGLALALALLLAAISHPSPAAAGDMKIKNGSAVSVKLQSRREAGIGLRPVKDGWQLVLGPEAAGASVELIDVTPGAPANKWVVTVGSDRVLLDPARFLPTHIYRMEVSKDDRSMGRALIYLYPPARKWVTRIDLRDEPPTEQATTLGAVPKSRI